jgi:2-polyprenyl-3-methyl-5-hydroxy-6-metoxy-1,4-benzoquinol methylase
MRIAPKTRFVTHFYIPKASTVKVYKMYVTVVSPNINFMIQNRFRFMRHFLSRDPLNQFRKKNMNSFESEVKAGQRFEFGKNWKSFLSVLNDQRIDIARSSLVDLLGIDSLTGKTFLDIGSGSGLFSLSARKLGAEVHSFDYDPSSVACTKELRSRYFPNDTNWIVEEGSILNREFLKSLGSFDIVYSWGVLHHTGNMWAAIENAVSLVKKGGTLCIALYNDQGKISIRWRKIKQLFCSGILGKAIVSGIFVPYFFSMTLFASVIEKRNAFAEYRKSRGMSITHDWFDWLGGLPFEVASVDEIVRFMRDRGFTLTNIKTTNYYGNNQFVFRRGQADPS